MKCGRQVIFDFDGTLADTAESTWEVASQLLTAIGRPVKIRSRDDRSRHWAKGALEATIGNDDAAILRAVHRVAMRYRSEAGVRLFDEVLAFAKALPRPAVIVTAALASGVKVALRENLNVFGDVLGHESGSKADILKSFDDNCIYIGDTVSDIRACRTAALPVVAVGWGFDDAVALQSAQPDFFIAEPHELNAWGLEHGLLAATASTVTTSDIVGT